MSASSGAEEVQEDHQAFGADAQRHDVLIGGLASRPAYVVQPATQAGVQLVQSYLRSRVDTRRLGPPRPELVAAWRWMARFDRAKRLITDAVGMGARLDLTSIAQRTGFYDHAHLDRDFAALTGTSPTRWLAEERRNIQAGGHRTSA